MFTKLLALFFATAAAVSALSIDTPQNLTQCGAVTITWHGKNSPFTLAVLPSCESEIDEPLVELAPMNATSYKWTVNLPSSTGAVAFAITDAVGSEAYTDEITIAKSDDAACLTAASASVSSSSIGATETPAGSSATASNSAVAGTTLVVSSTTGTAVPSAPANVAGASGTQANGATAPAGSIFAGMVGIATGLFALI